MKAVCNAAPVITQAKAGLVEILHSLFDRVVVTQAVVQKVQAGGIEDFGRRVITEQTWLEHVVLDPPASRRSQANVPSRFC
jgi:predicted nucleic acid-binding protein